MSTSGRVAAVDEHLTALTAELAAAENAQPADPARIAAMAWAMLYELSEASYARIDAEHMLARAVQTAQATVIDDRAGSRDPVVHIRQFLKEQRRMPPRGASTAITLAWCSEPRRARRHGFPIPHFGHR